MDRIEKKVLLQAPLSRVWRAISDHREFGSWFGVRFDGPFVAGSTLTGRIAPTTVDAEVAHQQKPHEGKAFTFVIERIEPPTLLAFRWHPYAVCTDVDYSKEPTTLVTFQLTQTVDGTLLEITESGFDGIPLARRAEAFTANEQGWTAQTQLIFKYIALHGAD